MQTMTGHGQAKEIKELRGAERSALVLDFPGGRDKGATENYRFCPTMILYVGVPE